eukprot:12179667-Heterocapsa_arctica.AAC.1
MQVGGNLLDVQGLRRHTPDEYNPLQQRRHDGNDRMDQADEEGQGLDGRDDREEVLHGVHAPIIIGYEKGEGRHLSVRS